MADKTERLVLVGGVDLGFRDGTGAKRRAVRGEEFEVDAATAEILLTDPNVARVEDAARPTVVAAAPATPAAPTKKELLARAAVLGIEGVGERTSNAAITEAIAAKEAELEAAGGTTNADPATAGSADETGDSTGGAITLGDLPAGAKVGAG